MRGQPWFRIPSLSYYTLSIYIKDVKEIAENVLYCFIDRQNDRAALVPDSKPELL
jgi:hypothetical protein